MDLFFVGTFFHTIDDTGRTSIPSKFRQSLEQADEAKRAYLLPLKSRIGVYPASLIVGINQRFNDNDFISEDAIDSMRKISGKFEEIKFDRQGRISIPEHFRHHASLDGEIVFVGCFKMFEIWSHKAWKRDVAEEQ